MWGRHSCPPPLTFNAPEAAAQSEPEPTALNSCHSDARAKRDRRNLLCAVTRDAETVRITLEPEVTELHSCYKRT